VSLVLALVGNLAILTTPIAHGHAHLEAAIHAHHDEHAEAISGAPLVDSRDSAVEEEDHADAHAHPDLSASVATRVTSLGVAAPPQPVLTIEPVIRRVAALPREREARARARPVSTSPPHLRAPPVV
jgi:hypothetical protein